MKTVGDLIRTLEYWKEQYPEFEKYNLCMDVAPDDAKYPDLRDICMFIDSDIGQVEIMADMGFFDELK